MTIWQGRQRRHQQAAGARGLDVFLSHQRRIDDVDLALRDLAPVALEEVARHPRRDPGQPGPERPSAIVVVPAAPDHQQDLLGQVLGVAGPHAVAPDGAAHVLELLVEGPEAVGEAWRSSSGAARSTCSDRRRVLHALPLYRPRRGSEITRWSDSRT